MATPDNTEPSRFRRIAGAIAGIGTGATVYGAEAYIAYATIDIIKAGFQSPDALFSTVSIICLLGIAIMGLHDLTTNRGEGLHIVLFSGVSAGLAVNQAILGA